MNPYITKPFLNKVKMQLVISQIYWFIATPLLSRGMRVRLPTGLQSVTKDVAFLISKQIPNEIIFRKIRIYSLCGYNLNSFLCCCRFNAQYILKIKK